MGERLFFPSREPSLASVERAVSQPRLARLCQAEAVDALAASGFLNRLPRALLGRMLERRAHAFAGRLRQFDDRIARLGLTAAGRWALAEWTAGLTVIGAEHIPRTGPLLVVSNHPGVVDAPAVLAQLSARRTRVLVADRPLLQAMPALRRHLFVVRASKPGRMIALRCSARHLRAGGTLLTYPAGAIEPDPALRRRDALAALTSWSTSTDCLTRLVPGLVVLPVIISGVLSLRFRSHLLARNCPTEDARDWLAATRQILKHRPGEIRPRLLIGQPLTAAHGQSIQPLIEAQVVQLIERTAKV